MANRKFQPTEEFNCVHPSLAGPLKMIEINRRELALTEAEAALQAALGAPPTGTEHLERLKSEISKMQKAQPAGQYRVRGMKKAVSAHRRGIAESAQGEIYDSGLEARALDALLLYYTDFNVEAFEAEYRKAFGDEIDNEPRGDKHQELRKAIKKHRVWLGGKLAWPEDWERKFFARGCPRNWGDLHASNHSLQVIADRVLKKFLEEYQRRSKLFRVPVTINGVAIAELPASHKERWETLYDALGLQANPDGPYDAGPNTLPLEEGDVVDTDGVPELFQQVEP